jgi:hypothetical protein
MQTTVQILTSLVALHVHVTFLLLFLVYLTMAFQLGNSYDVKCELIGWWIDKAVGGSRRRVFESTQSFVWMAHNTLGNVNVLLYFPCISTWHNWKMHRLQYLNFSSAYKTLQVMSLAPVNIRLLELRIRSVTPTLLYFMSIRSNRMQQHAGIYLLQNNSTCFGCPSHPSSGVHKTVTAASGPGHTVKYKSLN